MVQRDLFLKLDHFAVQQISSNSCNFIEPFATPLRETKAKHINYEGNLQWRSIVKFDYMRRECLTLIQSTMH